MKTGKQENAPHSDNKTSHAGMPMYLPKNESKITNTQNKFNNFQQSNMKKTQKSEIIEVVKVKKTRLIGAIRAVTEIIIEVVFVEFSGSIFTLDHIGRFVILVICEKRNTYIHLLNVKMKIENEIYKNDRVCGAR